MRYLAVLLNVIFIMGAIVLISAVTYAFFFFNDFDNIFTNIMWVSILISLFFWLIKVGLSDLLKSIRQLNNADHE